MEAISLAMARASARRARSLPGGPQIAGKRMQSPRTELESLVNIRTISGGETATVLAGTLAGAGCFRCATCGYAVALQELDEVPPCPHCEGRDFRRSSMFGELARSEPVGDQEDAPDWLDDAREALVASGEYLAYEDDDRVRVVALQEGWTRVGRSLSAHIRFDDPTVSRRHALIHRQDGGARILDDRSLNGVFVNGCKVDMRELEDGDQVAIGRFHLHYISLSRSADRFASDRVRAGAL
jgi:FHA domain/Zinc-ribbon containing domain